MILVDTSVYIAALTDKEIENMLKCAEKKAFIISSEVIEKEINKASDFLRSIGKKQDAEKLKELYNSTLSGTIKLTDRVINVSDKYTDKVRKKFGKDKAKKMKDDFRIVASASIGGIKDIATFNRKTMANEEIVQIYKEINSKERLKTPEFIKSKDDLFRFLSSS